MKMSNELLYSKLVQGIDTVDATEEEKSTMCTIARGMIENGADDVAYIFCTVIRTVMQPTINTSMSIR